MAVVKLNTEQSKWSRRYLAEMSKHLKLGREASLDTALTLGRKAVAIQLETLDVARIHERAMLTIANNTRPPKAALIRQAKKFFFEVLVPIEKTHHAAQKTKRLVKTVTQALRLRASESSAATRLLERSITRRKASETLLENSSRHLAKLLQESNLLQSQLREQTRSRLSTQEKARQYASGQFQDEIAQTLLAINLRLLTLKMSAKTSTEKLKNEIAETQILVKQSVKTIQRLAHEINHYHEA